MVHRALPEPESYLWRTTKRVRAGVRSDLTRTYVGLLSGSCRSMVGELEAKKA